MKRESASPRVRFSTSIRCAAGYRQRSRGGTSRRSSSWSSGKETDLNQDRAALNEKIAFEKWEGYAKPIERGRQVTFGEKFIFAPDYVMMSPHFNDGVPQSAAEMFSDEVAAAMAEYAPDGDMLTSEWRMWWKH